MTSVSPAPDGGEIGGHVGDCLARLGLDAAFDQHAVDRAELTRDDDPIAGPHDRAVRTHWLVHGWTLSNAGSPLGPTRSITDSSSQIKSQL